MNSVTEDAGLRTSAFNIAVIASGLGFFIDAFDLFLFNVYRIPSLKELGLSGTDLTHTGEFLLSMQMVGMMIGGILSGVLGDKRGRVSVLFASISIYSLANIANAFITDVNSYAIIRCIAGIGLAGELGAGISLVSESMTIEHRGYGTILVASLGAAGAVTAGLISDFIPWRTAFMGAGLIGLLLLFLRMKSMESGMFKHSKQLSTIRHGSPLLLFNSFPRLMKYVACIIMGIPIWYSVGLLITLIPEMTALHPGSVTKLSSCFILFQTGICLGEIGNGLLSQKFKTRKRVIVASMLLAVLATATHFMLINWGYNLVLSSFFMGLGCGYLSVFVTSTAEHFGTNVRVLVSATVTNFMRGAVTILIWLHGAFESLLHINIIQSLLITGVVVWVLALSAAMWLPDTCGRDLDFVEL